jgi:hypothetical protein
MNEIAVRGRPFPAGVSGNPDGRPVGSRSAFSQAFMRDLAASWHKDGAKVLERVVRDNPSGYFAVCARLLPSDVAISIQTQAPILDAGDLAVLRAIKESLPAAGSMTPGEVLNYVADAVRAHSSRQLIDATSEAQTESPNG